MIDLICSGTVLHHLNIIQLIFQWFNKPLYQYVSFLYTNYVQVYGGVLVGLWALAMVCRRRPLAEHLIIIYSEIKQICCKNNFSLKRKEMKSTIVSLFILTLIIYSHCLSYQNAMRHQQTADQQAYLKQLINIENNFGHQLQLLEQFANSVNKNISTYEGLTVIQGQALQTGIGAERHYVYQMDSQLLLPLENKTWDCQLLTKDQQDQINNMIVSAQKDITKLQNVMAKEDQCQKNSQIISQINFLNNYIYQLGQQISKNCPPTPPNNTNNTTPTPIKIALLPYSQNKNYIYGAQGQDGYMKSLQNLLDQGYIKKQCPISSPFPKNNSFCVGCPDDKQHYYDLTLQQCLTCPNGYIFIQQNNNKSCLMKQINSNPNAKNYIDQFPPIDPNLQTCPIQNPFFNGTHCIGCSGAAFYSFKEKICKVCPNGTLFDDNTHLCVYKKYNSFVQQPNINYCCGSLVNDPSVENCPKDKPFFNGKQCIQCKLPAYFSLEKATCTLCNHGNTFSVKQRNCIQNKYFQQFYTSNVKIEANTNGAENYAGMPAQIDQKYENIVICDITKPFSNNGDCQQCQYPNYYNFSVNQCQVCPENRKFDLLKHQCLQIVSEVMNSNMEYITNFAGLIPGYNSQISTCPMDRPFFNGYQCIECKLPKYVNFDTKQCKSCDDGKIFSLENSQCIVTDPKYYSDLSAANLYYVGSFQDWHDKIQNLIKQHPNIQKCPSQRPYFNFQNNNCQNCSNQYPLFDIKYNRCIRCDNSQYNAESRVCVVYGAINPTIERFMMNTAGWTF